MTSDAISQYLVLLLFNITKYFPLKYLIKLLAGSTRREVPATISISHSLINFIDVFNVLLSSISPYNTTSGFITPPQVHLGISLLSNTSFAV